jgi:hypothetical protein
MTPFERYLCDNGPMDDAALPQVTAADAIIAPDDYCIDLDCERCIGYAKQAGRISYCTLECYKDPKAPKVPYDHCSYMGHVNCPQTVRLGTGCRTVPAHIIGQCIKSRWRACSMFGKVSEKMMKREHRENGGWGTTH